VSEEHLPLTGYERLTESEMRKRAEAVLKTLKSRRTIRDFAETPVPRDIIENCIAAGRRRNGSTPLRHSGRMPANRFSKPRLGL